MKKSFFVMALCLLFISCGKQKFTGEAVGHGVRIDAVWMVDRACGPKDVPANYTALGSMKNVSDSKVYVEQYRSNGRFGIELFQAFGLDPGKETSVSVMKADMFKLMDAELHPLGIIRFRTWRGDEKPGLGAQKKRGLSSTENLLHQQNVTGIGTWQSSQ